MPIFDVAVLGLGTMGSFTCLELARRGLRVAGFDRFTPPHDRGSHSGDTRIFRMAYAENPAYVPLARRAGKLWDRYGEEFGSKLLVRSGMLSMGPPNGSLVGGIRRSAELHQLGVEEIPAREIRRRYPAIQPPDDYIGIFEAEAGWLDVNAAIRGALAAAEREGATLFRETAVPHWRSHEGCIILEAAGESIHADRLIIAAGAWAGSLLKELRLPLTILRKTLVWLEPASPDLFLPGRLPIFTFADRLFYGFPNVGGNGVKLSIHDNEPEIIADPSNPVAPPASRDIEPVLSMASRYLPSLAASRILHAATCFYTMTPDENFLIDRHPDHDNVWIAAGFSGHGFKFAPAIGELLADLTTTGVTSLPIDFLRMRPGLTRER